MCDTAACPTERANEGDDLVRSAITFTLGNHVDDLILNGSAAINGQGNLVGNVLTGNGAANDLRGWEGDDILNGGDGAERLRGDESADVVMFASALDGGNVGEILDFSVAHDAIRHRGVFAALAAGGLAADAFRVAGTEGADPQDRIACNQRNGALAYDADGSGSGASIVLATLDAGLALSHRNFVVIA